MENIWAIWGSRGRGRVCQERRRKSPYPIKGRNCSLLPPSLELLTIIASLSPFVSDFCGFFSEQEGRACMSWNSIPILHGFPSNSCHSWSKYGKDRGLELGMLRPFTGFTEKGGVDTRGTLARSAHSHEQEQMFSKYPVNYNLAPWGNASSSSWYSSLWAQLSCPMASLIWKVIQANPWACSFFFNQQLCQAVASLNKHLGLTNFTKHTFTFQITLFEFLSRLCEHKEKGFRYYFG